MNNPIIRSSFFATPNSYEELDEMIRNIGTPEEQRLAYLGAMMAFNLANKLIEDEVKETV